MNIEKQQNHDYDGIMLVNVLVGLARAQLFCVHNFPAGEPKVNSSTHSNAKRTWKTATSRIQQRVTDLRIIRALMERAVAIALSLRRATPLSEPPLVSPALPTFADVPLPSALLHLPDASLSWSGPQLQAKPLSTVLEQMELHVTTGTVYKAGRGQNHFTEQTKRYRRLQRPRSSHSRTQVSNVPIGLSNEKKLAQQKPLCRPKSAASALKSLHKGATTSDTPERAELTDSHKTTILKISQLKNTQRPKSTQPSLTRKSSHKSSQGTENQRARSVGESSLLVATPVSRSAAVSRVPAAFRHLLGDVAKVGLGEKVYYKAGLHHKGIDAPSRVRPNSAPFSPIARRQPVHMKDCQQGGIPHTQSPLRSPSSLRRRLSMSIQAGVGISMTAVAEEATVNSQMRSMSPKVASKHILNANRPYGRDAAAMAVSLACGTLALFWAAWDLSTGCIKKLNANNYTLTGLKRLQKAPVSTSNAIAEERAVLERAAQLFILALSAAPNNIDLRYAYQALLKVRTHYFYVQSTVSQIYAPLLFQRHVPRISGGRMQEAELNASTLHTLWQQRLQLQSLCTKLAADLGSSSSTASPSWDPYAAYVDFDSLGLIHHLF